MQPDRILNECDHFQMLFDYKIKREGGTANTSQTYFELEGDLTAEELHDYLLSNHHFVSLINMSIVNPLLGKARYRFGSDIDSIHIHERELESDDLNIIFGPDDIGSVPVKVTLIHFPSTKGVLFQFNHTFIDYNGSTNLFKSFEGFECDFFGPEPKKPQSFFHRLKSTFKVSSIMMKKWYQPKAFFHGNTSQPIEKAYILDDFTADETETIHSKIKKSHHIASISSLMLTIKCLAIREALDKRGEKRREFVFQQPFVVSSRKEAPYILGNRFSFLNYRLKAEEVTTAAEIQDEINRQTMEQIKHSQPHKFLELESVLRKISLRLHLWMISLPARGKMTTFAYTMVGEAKVIDRFAGRKILMVHNAPPVMRKPPLTFGLAYFEGRLRFEICYDKNVIEPTEAQEICTSIRRHLLS